LHTDSKDENTDAVARHLSIAQITRLLCTCTAMCLLTYLLQQWS